MARSFQSRLALKQSIIKRKILDNNIELEGNPTDCIRLRVLTNKEGDELSKDCISATIESIVFPPLKDVPYRKVNDNGSGHYSISSLVDSMSEESTERYKLIFTHKSDLNIGDVIIRVFLDPDTDEPTILALTITELLGTFGHQMLESSSCLATINMEEIPDETLKVISEMARRRLHIAHFPEWKDDPVPAPDIPGEVIPSEPENPEPDNPSDDKPESGLSDLEKLNNLLNKFKAEIPSSIPQENELTKNVSHELNDKGQLVISVDTSYNGGFTKQDEIIITDNEGSYIKSTETNVFDEAGFVIADNSTIEVKKDDEVVSKESISHAYEDKTTTEQRESVTVTEEGTVSSFTNKVIDKETGDFTSTTDKITEVNNTVTKEKTELNGNNNEVTGGTTTITYPSGETQTRPVASFRLVKDQ